MKITYENSNLLIIDDEEKRIYNLGDAVNISMRTSYSLDGFIEEISENKLLLKDKNNSSYSIGFDYIKKII
ncbi:hypothetical protein [Clostridium perfringens]|uniref:Uncharacterized protein n=2 Tax=Clostridium perfringens TaxID=1502 RepID=A0A8H9R060_CLOPF|nr:hypothetical protein [Clostridium perfringens]MDU7142941.1 hypothetical protein [Anaerococcus vaginalis]MDU7943773.1 hypothetical protein [Streptococcus salivarius]MDU7977697.1 hypothetical protein [Clostridioides difficile]EDT15783.1 putative ABC transporter, ATP binding protein [Clostridium perfringens E str. JGS1987]EGS5729076.1 hypothetical protein [Clostridium perfringens]